MQLLHGYGKPYTMFPEIFRHRYSIIYVDMDIPILMNTFFLILEYEKYKIEQDCLIFENKGIYVHIGRLFMNILVNNRQTSLYFFELKVKKAAKYAQTDIFGPANFL